MNKNDDGPVDIREKMHTIFALYAHSRRPAEKSALLDDMEVLLLDAAHVLACELLENGWRPDETFRASRADLRRQLHAWKAIRLWPIIFRPDSDDRLDGANRRAVQGSR